MKGIKQLLFQQELLIKILDREPHTTHRVLGQPISNTKILEIILNKYFSKPDI
jgi:hypothetical protein